MDNNYIKLVGVIIALGTLVYKFWTDRKSSKEKFEADIREKTSEQYLEFLTTLSNFLNNIKGLEERKKFLNLCYKMILVCNRDLKEKIEELLKLTLDYSENIEISSDDDFKASLKEEQLIEGIVTLMRYDIQKEHISKSTTDWMAAIEFLTVELKEENEVTSKTSKKHFWINSNAKYSGKHVFNEMIKNKVACTYGPPAYGKKLSKIKKGDYVYLYLNGAGIVASGIVNEEYNNESNTPMFTTPQNGETNEYSIGVDWDLSVAPANAINAKEIKNIGHALFVPTVMRISEKIGNTFRDKLKANKLKNP